MGFLDEKDLKNSSMRFALIMTVLTACLVAIGAVVGFILSICLNRELTMLGSVLGGMAGIIGSLLVPAFTGKSIQKKFESEVENDKTIE